MQAFLCILVIVLSLILFGIGMVRNDSEKDQSMESIEAMFRENRGADPAVGDNSTVIREVTEELPAPPPPANERAKATLLVELPPTNHPRSSSESFSLKESYLSLHQEFIKCNIFFDHLSEKISGDLKTSALLAGSLANGPIPLVDILRNRLFFRLEGTADGDRKPVLVLEALGESIDAAEQLAQLAQVEYLRFITHDETAAFHPKLMGLAGKLKEANEEKYALENDLEAFSQLSKAPSRKHKGDEIRMLLEACRGDKGRQVEKLREITHAFSANLNNVEALADLKGLREFREIRLLRENLLQLEASTKKYQLEGKTAAVAAHQKTAQNIRAQLEKEIRLTIEKQKKRLQDLLDQEIALSEQLAETQNDFAELSLKYPKANRLLSVRRSTVALEKQLKNASMTWSHARKYLVIGDLSKSIPPLQLQPIAP